MTKAIDLSGGLPIPTLIAPVRYFPHPSLVPRALRMSSTVPVALSVLRELGSCSEDGPDAVQAMVEATPDLPTDPSVEVPVVGGLSVLRSAELQADGTRKVVAWYATVSGLTFHADADGRVYVDGPGCRVILFDPASPAWKGKPPQPTVWAEETAELTDAAGTGARYFPAGKSKRYRSFAALVEARNVSRRKGTHGRIPDAVASLLSGTPMMRTDRSASVTVEDRHAPQGLAVRRVGHRYTLRLDDATAKRLHGERADSRQAVLRYDTSVDATGDDVGHAAMQLLREFDTETMVTVVGVLANAYDTGNRPQRIGAADLARIRGIELAGVKAKHRFGSMSRLLAEVVIEVRPVAPAKDDATAARLNLFARQGEVVVSGGHRLPLVTLNDTLYRAMQAKGHGIMLDRRMLTVDLNAHEWEFRIALALSVQWSLGWVRNAYAKGGKRLTRSARVLLADAGIPYDFAAERRKRGATAVRLRIRNVLDRLVGLETDLKSWKRTKEAPDPADDMYEFTPSATLAERLTTLRRPALDTPKQAPTAPIGE